MNLREAVGEIDLLLVTLDALRYDAATRLHGGGRTPFLSSLLPGGWEERHSPGNFTYSAHAAFFAGFLPTPIQPGVHPRRFALSFPGATTVGPDTCVFDAPNIVAGLQSRGYRTICIGGVGFFNRLTPLGSVLPGLFDESHWEPDFGVTCRDSTRHQVRRACERIDEAPPDRPLFLFLNVSAIHQPNRSYLEGATEDSLASHEAALEYTDGELPPLLESLKRRGRRVFGIITSDHGTLYGEDGYVGHRIGHPLVWTVPYGEFAWSPR